MRRAFLSGAAVILAIAGGSGLAAQHAVTASAAGYSSGPQAASRGPGVLLVCNGSTVRCPALLRSAGPYYRTVQGAVDAARSGDWILIYPGVYHEKSRQWPTAGVWIQKPGLHIRGLDRNRVIIDGSKGTVAHPCPSAAAQQDVTPRDGIVVWKASGVTIQNLTVCDYLAGSKGHGDEIWWNGGDGTGTIGLGSYSGSYLTATSEFASAQLNSPQLAQYGIFVSNSRGPGVITDSYASNMADAAYYVGACRRVCDTTLANDIGVNSALGYSGTNSGGQLVIRNSVFRLNRAGLAPNSMNNDDAPSPQDGRCPGSATRSCTIIEDNLIQANNNANAPGSADAPPVGTGVEIAGGSYDTMTGNVIEDQGSWGIVTSDNPDAEQPPSVAHCQGGVPLPGLCLFQARGNQVYGNVFSHDGFFGNQTNSDLATETMASYTPRNCFYRNVDRGGPLTSWPLDIEGASVDGQPCGAPGTGFDWKLAGQLACAADPANLGCLLLSYPQQTRTVMLPLPRLPSMPKPCTGVPRNAFCP
jgi:Periplasmic copper-binding protein (NosD)